VVVAAHMDSWDVGQGAHDDGQGCMIAWEIVRILKSLGIRPRRTIRCVLYVDEENRSSGGHAYARAHESAINKHVACMETDCGAFTANGFSFAGSPEGREFTRRYIMPYLAPLAATKLVDDGTGVDITPLVDGGVPGMHCLLLIVSCYPSLCLYRLCQ
jgi:carboxypeptidase Q